MKTASSWQLISTSPAGRTMRSRSGNGGHIWIFFEAAIPASIARRLGSHILTETMERRPDIGLDSYDRFFPNQDTVPSRPEVERVVPHRSPFFTSHRLIAWMYS